MTGSGTAEPPAWRRPALVIGLVLWLAAASARAQAPPVYRGTGYVLGMDETRGTLDLDHGSIPGFMPPMRMRFTVERVQLLRGLEVGDLVRFTLQAREDQVLIIGVERAPVRE